MTKREVILKELPFVKRVAEDIAEDIHVQRIDEKLLATVPSYSYHDGSCGVSEHSEKVLIVTQEEVYKVKQEQSWNSNFAHEQARYEKGETVLECIIRNRISPKDIQAIVKDEYTLDDWVGQPYVNRRETTIYLPPKNKSLLPEALKKYQEELVRSVRKEIADARG